jgi:ligand-binding sensor domain-containing protein/AraC-like DNA-binding protein
MKKYRILIAYNFLICISVISIRAEQFKQLDEYEGLSSKRCFSVCQDKNGFIWISTKLSIDRYDGQNYRHYDLTDSLQQRSNDIGYNFVCLSPDSVVWTFTQTGNVFQYDEASDSFRFIYSIYDYYQSHKVILNDIFFEKEHVLLLATTTGILRLDINDNTVIGFKSKEELSVNHILKNDDLYYLSTKSGLYVVRFSEESEIEVVAQWLKNENVNIVMYDSGYRQLWIGTFSDGMYILSKHQKENTPVHLTFTDKPIRAIIPYDEQLVAVGVDGDGILLVNRQNLKMEQQLTETETQDYALPSNSVWDLMLDRQKILWVATFHEGVSRSDPSNLFFQNFVHGKNNPQSISNNYINTVMEDSDGDLWFGTNNGVSVLNRQNGEWKHYFRKSPGQSHGDVILTLCETGKGKIWAGGYAFGMAEINKRSDHIKRYNARSSIIKTDYIFDIYRDEYSGNIWIGGLNGPISCYNPNTHESRFYEGKSLRCFSSCDDSTIVLGLYSGLYLMNIHTGNKQQTRIISAINDILKDGDRRYWIGTKSNGLYCYDLKTDSLRQYTKANGLSSNYVNAILKDERGDLWIGTEEGLNRLNPQTGQVVHFGKSNGLISKQFIPHASFRCSTNEMLFGSADGATLFSPSLAVSYQTNNQFFANDSYPLTFTEFQLFNVPVIACEKGSSLLLPINQTKKIILPHNQNYFSIAYVLPNYQLTENVSYSYYLKGFDSEWRPLTQKNIAAYFKIPPGKYTFHLRAYIGQQIHEEREIRIVILQPWWNTVVAWICYLLLFVASIYYLFNYLSRRKKQKEIQERLAFLEWQNETMKEIKKKNIYGINSDREQKFVDNLVQLIEKNLSNPGLNITMLCNELALSRTLLYKRVTQLTGYPPNEFIQIIRLKNAADLLISGKYSVTEVSAMIGIDNPKYFSRIFKQYYHVPPSNYMESLLTDLKLERSFSR